MARRIIDTVLYEALLEAYRDKPGNHSHAADHGQCDRRMAKRAYEKGWPKAPWAIPIKEVLQEDTIRARARRQEIRNKEYLDAEDQIAKARADAVDTRAQEGKMVTASRQSALGLAGFALRLLQGGRELSERLSAMIQANPDQFTPRQQLSMLREIARLAQQSVSVSQDAMRLERLHMGEPESILGFAEMESSSTDELMAELKDIEAALRTGMSKPDLRVVSDGNDND